MEIRRVNSEDNHFIELVKLLDAELAIRDGEEDHAFYDQFNKTDKIKHAMVATINDQPVGCGAIKEFDADSVEVKRMFVKLDRRGKGIAVILLTHLEQWAKELGHERCILETGIRQPEAIRLYEKCDYKVIENYGQYAGVKTSICFQKML